MTRIVLGIMRACLWLVIVVSVLGGIGWGLSSRVVIAQAFGTSIGVGSVLGISFGLLGGLLVGSLISGFGLLLFSINDHLASMKERLANVASEGGS